MFKINLYIFVISFLILGWLGVNPVTQIYSEMALRFSQMYFIFFILLYIYSEPREKNFSYIASSFIIILFMIYDLSRFGSVSNSYLIIGFLLVALYLIFMIISPIYSNLNKEKEVPERLT